MPTMLIALALAGADCQTVQAAYQDYLAEDASFRRAMTMSFGEEFTVRQVDQVQKTGGVYHSEMISREVVGDEDSAAEGHISLSDDEDGDPLAELATDCASIERDGAILRFLSRDEEHAGDDEAVEFGEFRTGEDGRLIPHRMVVDIDQQLLFVIHIQMHLEAIYIDYQRAP